MFYENLLIDKYEKMRAVNTMPACIEKDMLLKYIELQKTGKPKVKDFLDTGFTEKYIAKKLLGMNRVFDRASPLEKRYLFDNFSFLNLWALTAVKLPSIEVITSAVIGFEESGDKATVKTLRQFLIKEWNLGYAGFIKESVNFLQTLEIVEKKKKLSINKHRLSESEKESYLYYVELVGLDETLARKIITI